MLALRDFCYIYLVYLKLYQLIFVVLLKMKVLLSYLCGLSHLCPPVVHKATVQLKLWRQNFLWRKSLHNSPAKKRLLPNLFHKFPPHVSRLAYC